MHLHLLKSYNLISPKWLYLIVTIYSSGMEVANTVTKSEAPDLLVYSNNDDILFVDNGHLQL